MPSIPLTADEEAYILKTLGLQSTEDLFQTVPPKIREKAGFTLEEDRTKNGNPGLGLGEHELRTFFHGLGAKNAHFPAYKHFLGGGIYDNVIPAIVNQLVLRGEFLTCYTPYQPELSQGTLQAIFEFQTMICRITGMPVANASMYDGATSLAEAALMAQRISTQGKNVLIAANVTPDYRSVVDTFLSGHADKSIEVPYTNNGTLDLDMLSELIILHKPCALMVQSPNYFGMIESLDKIKALLPKETLLIVAVADPSALSIFEAPGNLGADIVVGEAHQLGTPMLYGGPHVGFFASRKEYLRQMPGRLCGESVDKNGKRAYTLTLSTREQHIRREKATSNICTNQGLIALRTTIYLSFLGKEGFKRLGEMNYSLFHSLKNQLHKAGIKMLFESDSVFREGAFIVPNLNQRFQNALDRKIVPGIKLKDKFKSPNFENALLICAHPKNTKADIDLLVEVLSHD